MAAFSTLVEAVKFSILLLYSPLCLTPIGGTIVGCFLFGSVEIDSEGMYVCSSSDQKEIDFF